MVGSYQVGDIVSYCREARAGEHGLQWSVGSRLIVFEKDRNSLGETQPRTCWVICGSVPVGVAIDRLRPCTQRNCLLFITRKSKNLHLLLRTHRCNKASSTNVLHSILRLSIRHEMQMKARTKTSGTTKCQRQHKQRKQKREKSFRRTKQQKSYGHRYL